jgi:HD-GYP domain-containing protein (c-di-GMP phosphodiesterase class II)
LSTQSFAERLSSASNADLSEHPAHHALESLIDAVDRADTYRRGHSRRVAAYATDLARIMGSNPSEIALVNLAALVHDVGKIGVPAWVLRKAGELTEAERHLIRLHPIIGASILSRMPDMENVVPIVLHHHECWDGSGYSSRLKGVDIPVQSRMIFVVEAYDAITNRSTGEESDVDGALETLRRSSGKQFDPLIVDAMHEAWRNGMLDPTATSAPETVRLT